MTCRDRLILAVLLTFAVACAVAAVILLSGCAPHVARAAVPISESHSQITASEYDLVESAFAGGQLAPMPVELADARCQALLEKRNTGRAIVYGLGGLTGAGGIATLIPKDATDEERKKWDLGIGLATLGTATVTTILGALVQSWTDEYERECITETPAPAEHPASDEIDADGGL